MRNLKRVLSLALAAMMLIGMMVVGASAAGYSDFTDKDEIVHTEAVQVLNALGVIDGKEDGSFFDPTGNVTRAEMAKMITIICLGNVDVSAFQGTATDLTDISTNWAEAYIKYCYSQGIIAGRGDNTFDPTANVTAVEAAKMLLVAIGYNSKVQVYEGNSWAINVTRDAQLSGFFDDLSVTSTKELTRDEAAQMIYNAVDAYLIEKTSTVDREDGSISDSYRPSEDKTLLTETFDVTTTKAVMGAVSYDKDDAEYTYALDVMINSSNTVESAADYSSLYGMKVKVLWTKDKAGDTVVYGIYADKSAVVTSAAYHTVSDGDKNGEIKIDGTTYKLDSTGVKNVDYFAFNTGDNADPTGYEMVNFIDMDGNGKIDKAIYVPFEVKKVTYVGAKSYSYADPEGGASERQNFDDTGVSVYDGIAKDDYIAVVQDDNSAKSVIEITKLEEQSGKVTSTKSDNQVQIDGTWYKIANNDGMLGNEYDFVAVNGYIVYADGTTTTAAIEDYVVVTGYQEATGFQKHDQVEVIRSSGETEIIELEDDLAAPTKGTMYVLTDDDNDDLYVLEEVATEPDAEDGTTGGFDGYSDGAYDKESGKAGTIGGMSIADDAVVFVKDGSKYKVITGAELAKVSKDAVAVVHAYYNTNDTTGFNSVVLAYVQSDLTTTSDLLYGYVTADVTTSKNDDDDKVNTVTFWGVNGEETLVTDKAYDDLAKGVYFEYMLDGDGNMTKVQTYTVEDNGYAVSAYDGTKITLVDDENTATTYEIDEDTVIIYVDSDDTAGVEGSSIALAGKNEDGTYIKNVVAVDHGDDTLDILFVDIANEIQ